MIDRKEIGAAIKVLRQRHRLSQKDFGRILKFGNTDRSCQNAISRIESGTQAITVDELMNIANFFNVSLDNIVSGIIVSSNAGEDTALLVNARLFKLFPGVRSKLNTLNNLMADEQDDDLVRQMCIPVFEKIYKISITKSMTSNPTDIQT